MWKDLKDAASHSAELERLAESLPAVVLASRASNTVNKYSGGFARWKTWAQLHGILILPASPFHVSLYLRFLMQDAKTDAPLRTAIYSIDWVHRLAGELTPGSHPLVTEIMAAAKRLLAHQTKKKSPLTPCHLECLVRDKASSSASLLDIRTVAAALLAFAAFLRFDELVSLHISDITFKDSYMIVFIESSKTDQYRDGAWVPVVK